MGESEQQDPGLESANYVREVVTRYRDNPTIWAWELGNEFSLHGDLPNAEHAAAQNTSLPWHTRFPQRADDLAYDMVHKAFTAFGTAVRENMIRID